MALVTCPECGRERVSDLAETCPECGFPIKAHFEKERKKIKSERIEKSKKEEKIEKIGDEEKSEYGIDDFLLDNQEKYKPQKPNVWLEEILPNLGMGIIAFAAFCVISWIFDDIVDFLSNLFLIIAIGYLIGFFVHGLIRASEYMDFYNSQLQRWEENPAQFFKDEQERKMLAEQQRKWEEEMKLAYSGKTICPNCGGTSFTPVRKKWDPIIGYMTNKVELVCNNCGHRINNK